MAQPNGPNPPASLQGSAPSNDTASAYPSATDAEALQSLPVKVDGKTARLVMDKEHFYVFRGNVDVSNDIKWSGASSSRLLQLAP